MVPILITLACTLSNALSAGDVDNHFGGIPSHASATTLTGGRKPQLLPTAVASAPKEGAEPRKRDEDEAGAEASQDQENTASGLTSGESGNPATLAPHASHSPFDQIQNMAQRAYDRVAHSTPTERGVGLLAGAGIALHSIHSRQKRRTEYENQREIIEQSISNDRAQIAAGSFDSENGLRTRRHLAESQELLQVARDNPELQTADYLRTHARRIGERNARRIDVPRSALNASSSSNSAVSPQSPHDKTPALQQVRALAEGRELGVVDTEAARTQSSTATSASSSPQGPCCMNSVIG